jgi:hypothetical protein
MTTGFVALALGLFGWLLWAHVRAGRYFDRPAIARHPLFDPLLFVASALLAAAGLFLVWRARPAAGAAAAGILGVLWAYRRVIRGARFQRWLLGRDYRALRRRHPDLPERAILIRLVIARHPGWGEELVEQMVLDYPTLDDIAPLLARMEQGFRGFR